MLTEKEYHKLIHELARAALTVRQLKKDADELVAELEDLAKDFDEIKEKMKKD